MQVNKTYLERKVEQLNKWMQNHPVTHFSYNQKKQNHSYYMGKLCDMDDLGLKTIKI